MPTLLNDTELQILEAARKVFVRKGFDGARMQEIADEAGINKALLHYYFRSKDKLFEAIFAEAFQQLGTELNALFIKEDSFIKIIDAFIDKYIDLLLKNPYLPLFVINELSQRPGRLFNTFKNHIPNPELLFKALEKAVKKKEIRKINPQHFILTLLGACIFPFIARPIMTGFLFKNNQKSYDIFLNERKAEVLDFIKHAIKK